MLSNRPHAMTNYQLQGTTGCYESARTSQWGERNKVWLTDLTPDANTWLDLASLEGDYLPAMWRNPAARGARRGSWWRGLLRDHGFRRQYRGWRAAADRYPRGARHDIARG